MATQTQTESVRTTSNGNGEWLGREHMTLFNLLQGFNAGRGKPVGQGGKSIAHSLKPAAFPRKEGLRTITAAQLLSVRVPVARIVNGRIEGYQRKFDAGRARAIGRWLEKNRTQYMRTLPVIEISVTPDGEAFYTDGQHRAGGAVIAGLAIRAVVTRRTAEEARRLFTLQGKAIRPSRNLLIIDSDGPFEEYIQDALTRDDHPWSELITTSPSGNSKTKMSATAAFTMLQIFVSGKNSPAGRDVGMEVETTCFKKEDADLLATLMYAFGQRSTNPLAYAAISLRAIALCSRSVFKNREPHPDDVNRWIRRMPMFQFGNFVFLRSSNDLANAMIKYWNTGLSAARKAQRIE